MGVGPQERAEGSGSLATRVATGIDTLGLSRNLQDEGPLALESSSDDVDNSDGVHADLKERRLWMTPQLCPPSEAAFSGPTTPGRGNVTLWKVMLPVQSAPGSLLTYLIFVGVLQASRHLASRVCRWQADLRGETSVETILQTSRFCACLRLFL